VTNLDINNPRESEKVFSCDFLYNFCELCMMGEPEDLNSHLPGSTWQQGFRGSASDNVYKLCMAYII
jgi:hypothetical protein